MEQLGAHQQEQTAGADGECVRICHCKAYKGIRENIKQEYAGIADRMKKQATRADKCMRAWSSWGVQQEQTAGAGGERVRICHYKPHNGIRANVKQAYAGINRPQEKASHKSR